MQDTGYKENRGNSYDYLQLRPFLEQYTYQD